ncbi:hypothetical protein NERG_02387 [Nematocida ausubeli]|uniref:Uncharacterized protein n=1 Tax=Nematocida ausubeli (strain ATCC PRA-371 / ERTm2) TaxID=1913371 RepID=H8ZFL6_NEMA1|nr:hypothetical protein NERG_02387 [Nematocida ausubeli]
MKVFECKLDEKRSLVAVDRKYMKISTATEIIDLNEIDTSQILPAGLEIILHEKKVHKLSSLEEEDLKSIQEVIKSRRMISKEELSNAIKKNIQLQNTYKNINESEHKIFYKIFGEVLLKNIKIEEIQRLEQPSSSEKAKFLISNRIAMNAFFNLNITFRLFVNYFYTGYLMANSQENEVDLEIFRILGRQISQIERINVRSMLLQEISIKEETIKEKQKAKSLKKDSLINPDLVKLLNHNTTTTPVSINNQSHINPQEIRQDTQQTNLPEKTAETQYNPDINQVQHNKISQPVNNPLNIVQLQPPIFKVTAVEPMKRVGVPLDILRRMKEISKLIYKNKVPSEELEVIANNLQQFLKDEIRRKLPIDEGNAVISAINRITPSRFLNLIKDQPSK